MNILCDYCKSSIGKKQIVAVTGLFMILFLVGHLAGNLLLFLGPEVYNAYAHKLAGLRPGLYVIEIGLVIVFIVHILVTAWTVWENIQARPINYAVIKPSEQRSLATKLMPYTGTYLLAFVLYHLFDFTFTEHEGGRSILVNGQSYGLFGVVYNSFLDPIHSVLYIFAMFCLGFHLWHGVDSFMQTFGLKNEKYASIVEKTSHWFAALITVGYSSIPLGVMWGWIKY